MKTKTYNLFGEHCAGTIVYRTRFLRSVKQKRWIMAGKLVIVETFSREVEALIIKTRLDAEGIECFVADGNMSRIYPGVIGVRLFVREEDLERMKKILRDARLSGE